MHPATLLALLLASSVSARFIPAWCLHHPTILGSNLDQQALIPSIEESKVIQIIKEGLL
jgi:hypothetical protein